MLGLELILLGVFDEHDELVGIGPFYRRDLITPFGFRIRRLHWIGTAWQFAPTVRTEYCGLILKRDRASEICGALVGVISQWQWDEWVLCDVVDHERERLVRYTNRLDGQTGQVLRLTDEGIRVDTHADFCRWLAGLGKSTRLKAYNRRHYLRELGELEFSSFDPVSEGDFLDQLNLFHMDRWGKPAFDEEAVRFHRQLMVRLPNSGGQVHCSVLRFNGDCISVLYDVTIDGQRFNLQSGYMENFDRRISLGSLHLGFAIEEAFNDPRTSRYDLLAGGGKKNYYKHHFHGEKVHFRTVQLVRGRGLRLLYRGQSSLPDTWRHVINRWFRL